MNNKSSGYQNNVAWLMVFDILINSGNQLMSVGDESSIPLDIKKRDIYEAEKRIKKFQEEVQPFKQELTKKVKAKVRNIIEDVIKETMKLDNISPEIIATQLLFVYFITYKHKKIEEDFKYFMNETNYYPILDRVEKSKLIDANEVFNAITNIIERNR